MKIHKILTILRIRMALIKNSTELVERLKIDLNETQCSQGYEGTGVSFTICFNRKISSVEFFIKVLFFSH